MTTECNQEPFPFHPLNQREVRGQFDGGSITSDAGGLLLREVEKQTNIIGQFSSCFTDYRDPELVAADNKEPNRTRHQSASMGSSTRDRSLWERQNLASVAA